MKNVDINYLCLTVGNLSGIPIRIYEDEKLVFYHSVVRIPKDPICVYINEILKIDDHVGYFVTKHFHYYGIINAGKMKIVFGPTRQITGEEQELKELAFRADVPTDEIEEFVTAMKSIIPMPLESILQILCTVNYVANDEKLTLSDIYLHDSDKDFSILFRENEKESSQDTKENIIHNTLSLEETIMSIVQHGDVSALDELVKKAPAVRSGKLASGQMRQIKNTFIVTATLASRAAIRGGLNTDEALSMSDRYIQHCELIDDIGKIMNLQFKMIVDYTERVSRVRFGNNPSKLVTDVANYIQRHLSEPVSTEEMAKSLYLSRSRLSTKFKEITNMTLTDFILKELSYLSFQSQYHENTSQPYI